jgi:uncharacterized protein YbbK (DUF523 family)
MTVVVSACLLGTRCTYKGGDNLNDAVISFLHGKEVIPLCPETLGGLPTPRTPAEIRDEVVVTKDGGNVDSYYRDGVRQALEMLEGKVIDLAILQPRSPSCGVKQVYDGSFSHTLVPGMGVFAAALKKRGIRVIEPSDLP